MYLVRTIACILVVFLSQNTFAATALWNAKVTRIMTDETLYGGCAAYLSVVSEDQGLACTSKFVTMDCLGSTRSKSIGDRFLQAAQLALITDRTVKIKADDSRIINNMCVVTRIDNY